MTSYPSHPNSGPTDEAWRQIDELVEAVAGLSTSDLAPSEFYAGLMDRIVPALAAVGGAVWTSSPEVGLRLEYQVNLARALESEDQGDQRRHARLIEHVLQRARRPRVPLRPRQRPWRNEKPRQSAG